MCTHVETADKKVVKNVLGPKYEVRDYQPEKCANGFADPDIPAIISIEPQVVQPIMWGFMPPSVKQSYTTKNARAETMFEKDTYADSARERRCILVVKGFYEWKWLTKSGSKKEAYYIGRGDGNLFYIGGIWKEWPEPGNTTVKTFSLITVDANKLLEEVRPQKPRMPFILEQDQWATWLSNTTPIADLKAMMQPYKDGELQAIHLPVSPLSNSSHTVSRPGELPF